MYLNKKVIAIIVAAGKGTRMNLDKPKQYINLKNKTILEWTIDVFEVNKFIDEIILVVDKDMKKILDNKLDYYNKIVSITNGGKNRMESVWNGISEIKETNSLVLIHDGVRPFVTQDIINKCIDYGIKYKCCIPAVEIVDTLKSSEDGFIEKTVDRNSFILAQTPQTFTYDIIKTCYEKAVKDKLEVTDDASVVENYGYKIKIIKGSRNNIKITNPFDLKIAKAIMDDNKDKSEK